jgi:uncharacterized damage-inducible protein DinB
MGDTRSVLAGTTGRICIGAVCEDWPVTWKAPEVDRVDDLASAPERQALEAWLKWHRQTLMFKCQGLTGEQLCERSVPPSALSLLGLVRHMAYVERVWFRARFGQQDLDLLFNTEQSEDADFNEIDPQRAEADFGTFRAECVLADEAARGHSLDETFERRGEILDLRWVYVHMIEEYARHNGHADLLRERIDGVTGD